MLYTIVYSDPHSCVFCIINGGSALLNKVNFCATVPQNERHVFTMKLFNTHELITRKDIEIALKVSQATAILIIREMLAQGMLIKEKGGKYSRYKRGKV